MRTTSQPKTSITAFQLTDELRKDLDRYATINTEGNRSWAIRKLLRQALATERQQAA
jgi:metal-responsive CopG/Arc/MetJ family transcriptional regulator